MKRTTIFCIHGNSGSSKFFQDFVNVPIKNVDKVTLDLLGHGTNQNKEHKLEDLSFNAQKEFLLAELKKINSDIILVGNSLGGHLAIEVAPEFRNLKGLVIMGTSPVKKPINFDEAFHTVPVLNHFFTENPTNEDILAIPSQIIMNTEKHQFFIDGFKEVNPLVRKAIAIDIHQGNLLDEYKIFTTLDIPTYIIAGDNDITINRSYLEFVKNNSKQCKIIDFKNCGHYPTIDKPIEFNRFMSEIVKKSLVK